MKILKPIGYDDKWLTLAAVDAVGDLLIRVELATWEQVQASGPDWMDSDDRRDHGLSIVEQRAARIEPVTGPQGRVITID